MKKKRKHTLIIKINEQNKTKKESMRENKNRKKNCNSSSKNVCATTVIFMLQRKNCINHISIEQLKLKKKWN